MCLNILQGVGLLILAALIIEGLFSPRIEVTRERDVLLFYGRRTRKYIKLFKLK